MSDDPGEEPVAPSGTDRVPLVFISYSHDSPEHKRWVAELASELRRNGIEVVLDQWDLRLGDDVPKFMERSVRSSDRVLVICTSLYIGKFNDGVGGVGYESVVVTGELIRDLGTAKFIPIVRDKRADPFLPSALGTRLYMDFTDDAKRVEAFEQLLRELHNVPASQKPPLGANPFALTPEKREVPSADSAPVLEVTAVTQAGLITALSVYRSARDIALKDDQHAWRKLATSAKREARRQLMDWATTFLTKSPSVDAKERMDEALQGVATFTPLIAMALAGVESGRERYVGQFSLMEDVLNPEEWVHGGLTHRIELPDAAAFVFQALHGAMCVRTGQLPVALRFLRTPVYRRDRGETVAFWRVHEFIGWPGPFDGDSRVSWRALAAVEQEWEWVGEVFGSKSGFRESLTAYYLSLSLHEYAMTIKERGLDSLVPGELRLDTPTHFAAVNEDVGRRAYRLLVQEPKSVKRVWQSLDIDDKTAMSGWSKWLAVGDYWHNNTYHFSHGYLSFAKDLVTEVVAQCRLLDE